MSEINFNVLFIIFVWCMCAIILSFSQNTNKNNVCKLHNGLVIETYDGKHLCLDKKSLLEESE